MLRLVALLIILLAGGLAYEEITGDQIGIKATMRSVGDVLGSWAQGARSPAFGGWGGLGQ